MVFPKLKRYAILLAAVLGVTWASPSLADSARDASVHQMQSYMNGGFDSVQSAETAHANGDDGLACFKFNEAVEQFESAIFSSVGYVISEGEDRSESTAFNKRLQGYADSARANAKIVCAAKSAPSTFSGSGSAHTPGVELRTFQARINTAYLHANDAAEQYQARRFTDACASARLSAAHYQWAKNNLPEEQGFSVHVPGKQINENFQLTNAAVNDLYCKDGAVAAATPLATTASGSRSDMIIEGKRHQSMAVALETLGNTRFAANDFKQACDNYRQAQDQWNQFLLLVSLYSSGPEAIPTDADDFKVIQRNRDLEGNKSTKACDARDMSSMPHYQIDPAHRPIFAGNDLSDQTQALYDLVDEYYFGKTPLGVERATALNATCAKGGFLSDYTTVLMRICDAVLARFPNPKIEPCWHYQQGKDALASLGGFLAPNIGPIFEYVERQQYCNNRWDISYADSADDTGLAMVRSERIIVAKAIPEIPKAAVKTVDRTQPPKNSTSNAKAAKRPRKK